MRYFTILAFMLASGVFASSQGSCTEAAVKEGNLPMAEGAFSHVPSFAKPVIGRAAYRDAAETKLAGRTNIEHSWESDRLIVASVKGDMDPRGSRSQVVEFSSCSNQFLVSHDDCSSKPRGEK